MSRSLFTDMDREAEEEFSRRIENRLKTICNNSRGTFLFHVKKGEGREWSIKTHLRTVVITLTDDELTVRFPAMAIKDNISVDGRPHNLVLDKLEERVLSRGYVKEASFILASLQDKMISIATEDRVRSLEVWEEHDGVRRTPGGMVVSVGGGTNFVPIDKNYFLRAEELFPKS